MSGIHEGHLAFTIYRQSRAARASLVKIPLAVFWPLGALIGTGAGDTSCLSFESVVGVAEKMLVLVTLVF